MSEKYLGEVSTPLLINQIKEKCTQKRSTLPIASIDELGNTYQYTGTTSGSIVHNYFYECVSDGAVTPTYSWSQVNTQPTAGTPTASGTTFDNTTSELSATNVQDAIDEVESRVDTAESDIDNIEGKIPSTATSSNKLIDHDSLGTAAFKDSTDRVSPNNTALVESQSVYSAINTALSSIYTPRGDITCAELTSDLLIAANVGNIYETSDSGTTTALFLQGAGVTIATGSNVGIISAGQGRILFNLMANAFDLTDYQKKDLTQAVEGETTVEGALGALSTNKQAKTLTTSVESQTTVEGALGALSTNKATQAEVNDIVNVLGAKNLLPNKATTQTIGGVTYTINSDGTINMSGANTSGSWINLNICDSDTLKAILSKHKGQKMIFSMTQDYDYDTRNVCIHYNIGGTDTYIIPNPREIEFTVPDNIDTATSITVPVGVNVGETANTYNLGIMLRPASIQDSTYEPYARTNQELTAKTDGLWDNTMNNGAVNLLENVGTTTTVNGITFTVNSDGTVTVSGTATANASLTLKMRPYLGNSFPLKLSGCPAGGSFSSGYRLQYANYFDMTDLVSDEGDGAIITKQIDYTTYPNARISIEIRSGTQISSPIVFKPMVSDASLNLSYNDYVPYAKTNKELTEKIDIVGNLFTTTTKVVDNIAHGIATTIATLGNLPIGTYVVSGQFNSDSAMSGGGLIQFVSSGVIQNGASCNTMINQGFKANAGLTGIFNVTNATNQINLQIYTANADLTVVSVKLAAIRIA